MNDKLKKELAAAEANTGGKKETAKQIRDGGLVPVEITAENFRWNTHTPVEAGTIIGMTEGQAHSAEHNKFGKIVKE